MASAKANPQAKNYGTNILGIVAEQTAYGTKREIPAVPADKAAITAQGGKTYIVEFAAPYGLTPIKQFHAVQRQKGHPTPDPSIPGMEMGGGQLNFYLDPTLAPFWLKHLLQASAAGRLVDDGSVTLANKGKPVAATLTGRGLSVAANFGLHTIASLTPALAAGTADAFGAETALTTAQQPKAIIAAITGTDYDDNVTNATVYQPTPPEGMNSGRIKLTFGSTTSDIKVVGNDQNGAPIEEVLKPEVDSSNVKQARTIQKTTQYYRDGVKLSKKGTGDLAVSAVAVDLEDVREHWLEFDSGVSEGLTLEVHEGNSDSPITYADLLISRGIIRFSELCMLQFFVLASQVFPRQAMAGGAVGTNIEHFDRLDFHAVPNLGMLWEVGQNADGTVPADMVGSYRLAQIGIAMDNRLSPPSTSYEDNFFYPKLVRQMNREVQTQVVIDYSKEANFDAFVQGLKFDSKLSAISRPYGGPYRAIEITGNGVQMTGYPRRGQNQLGEVTQAIVMRSQMGSKPNDDTSIRVINTEATI